MSLRRPIHLADLVLGALYATIVARAALRSRIACLLVAVVLNHVLELNVTLVQLLPGDVPGELVRLIIEMILGVAHCAHILQ